MAAFSDMIAELATTSRMNRLGKARNALRMMNIDVWKSSQYSTKTKVRLYKNCVPFTLLYGSKCWRMTNCDLNKLFTFYTKNIRRILRIFWPEAIPTNNFSPAVTKRAWRPSSCEGNGDGSHMSPAESRAASFAQLYIGHQKENESGDDPRKPSIGLWKGSSRPYSTPNGAIQKLDREQTGVAFLCCCPTCLTVFTGMSE